MKTSITVDFFKSTSKPWQWATGVAAATVGLVPLTIAGMGATGFFTYRWIKHRARNGIRF